MGNEKLKEMGQRLFINDDVTPLRGKVVYLIRQNEELASVTTVHGKLMVCLKSSDNIVFKNF